MVAVIMIMIVILIMIMLLLLSSRSSGGAVHRRAAHAQAPPAGHGAASKGKDEAIASHTSHVTRDT